MNSRFTRCSIANVILMALGAAASAADNPTAALNAGESFSLGGKQAVVRKLDFLPLVENDYSRRFKFDAASNPKLAQLRAQNKLDEVVAPGKDEFDRQVLLLDWVNRRFKKFGTPSAKPHGALEILHDIDDGHTFFCAHYADVLASAAASLGWIDRTLALRRPAKTGSGEHSSTEIWSNQFGKWILFDPTFAMYVEKDGQPLNAYELRQEWFYNEGKDLTFVLGKDRQRYKKADLPLFRQRFAGFGDLKLDDGALDVYAFIGYVPNTDLMDAGPDYGQMFITRDKLCDGTEWHKRVNPAKPAEEPYFPLGQAALELVPAGEQVRVNLKTLTPNFKTFEVRTDDGPWKPCGSAVDWQLHAGANRLEARTLNAFDVQGHVSVAEIELRP